MEREERKKSYLIEITAIGDKELAAVLDQLRKVSLGRKNIRIKEVVNDTFIQNEFNQTL